MQRTEHTKCGYRTIMKSAHCAEDNNRVLNRFFSSAQGFSRFPCVYKLIPRWFPTLQVATACFSCSPPDLNFLDPYFIFMYVHNNNCHRATDHLHLNLLLCVGYVEWNLFLDNIPARDVYHNAIQIY